MMKRAFQLTFTAAALAFKGEGWEAIDRGERTPPRPTAVQA
jgi:hypothetical protein